MVRGRTDLLADARRVLDVLAAGPGTVYALAAAAGLAVHTTRRTLAALARAGWPVTWTDPPRRGSGGAPGRVYALAAREREAHSAGGRE